jgi:glycosyltransferase involved in cell wall biosynthesis
LKILVGAYSGHPVQVQLSRALAARGHEVLHLFSTSSETPKGELQPKPGDPTGFAVGGIRLDGAFDKYNFVKRRRQEIAIGKRFAREIASFAPDVAILSNQPIDALSQIVPVLRAGGSRFIFWLQDLLGEAASAVLSARLGLPGRLIGGHDRRRERGCLAGADHIVAISEDFRHVLASPAYRMDRDVTVVENWAPLDAMPLHPRDSDWAREHLPDHPFRVVYAGTLGMKQNGDVLLDVAAAVDSSISIFSQGVAARRIADRAREGGHANIEVRAWLDFADLPLALAGADVLVVTLEKSAGIFSVPSKVLTYMCVGRPILAAIPGANLAARLIRDIGCGIVVEPDDEEGFVDAARQLASDKAMRDAMGRAGRAYAERTFDIEAIADKFEAVIDGIMAKGRKA